MSKVGSSPIGSRAGHFSMATTIDPKPAFAELCAKTNFSLLEGGSRPEEMVEASKALGQLALAVADRNGCYGSVRAHEAVKKLSHRYIVGAELPVDASRVVFLVESHAGYRSLCRLLTTAHADLLREEARFSVSQLDGACGGLFAILRVLREPAADEGLEVAGALRACAEGCAFVATSRFGSADDRL